MTTLRLREDDAAPIVDKSEEAAGLALDGL